MRGSGCRRSDVRCARVRRCSPLIDQRRLNGIECTLVMRLDYVKLPLDEPSGVRGGNQRHLDLVDLDD